MPAGSRSFSAPAIPIRAARTFRAPTSGRRPIRRRRRGSAGWDGILTRMPAPVDPLTAWSTRSRDAAHAARADGGRRLDSRASPSTRSRAPTPAPTRRPRVRARPASPRTCPSINRTSRSSTRRRRPRSRRSTASPRSGRTRRRSPIPTTASDRRCEMVAGAIARGVGTSIYWVQTGGYDTHAGQNTNVANGSYNTLMTTLNGGLFAFYAICSIRDCSPIRSSCSSRSSAAASARTAATAPTTAPPA